MPTPSYILVPRGIPTDLECVHAGLVASGAGSGNRAVDRGMSAQGNHGGRGGRVGRRAGRDRGQARAIHAGKTHRRSQGADRARARHDSRPDRRSHHDGHHFLATVLPGPRLPAGRARGLQPAPPRLPQLRAMGPARQRQAPRPRGRTPGAGRGALSARHDERRIREGRRQPPELGSPESLHRGPPRLRGQVGGGTVSRGVCRPGQDRRGQAAKGCRPRPTIPASTAISTSERARSRPTTTAPATTPGST